jgi:hypothetical protein
LEMMKQKCEKQRENLRQLPGLFQQKFPLQ